MLTGPEHLLAAAIRPHAMRSISILASRPCEMKVAYRYFAKRMAQLRGLPPAYMWATRAIYFSPCDSKKSRHFVFQGATINVKETLINESINVGQVHLNGPILGKVTC